VAFTGRLGAPDSRLGNIAFGAVGTATWEGTTAGNLAIQLLTIVTPQRMPDMTINPPDRTTLTLNPWSAA